MKHIKCIAALLVITGFYHATAQNFLQKKAPQLQLKTMLQVAGDGQWATNLEGKVVVLEFWATWCTPCMASVAHMNELSKHFAGRNVQFISITREPEKLIKEFLQKRTMSGWVGIDSLAMTFKNYEVTAIPRTFVIDAKGIVRFSGEPQMLNAQIIDNVLTDTYHEALPQYAPAIKLGSWSPGDDPVFTANFDAKKTKVLQQTIIRQSAGSGGTGTKSFRGCVGINIMNRNLPAILAFIDDLPSAYRVINNSAIPDTALWDAIFLRNKDYDLSKGMKELRASVLESFSVTVKDSVVRRNVLVPAYGPAAKVFDEKNIDFDKPETHTLRPLKTIYDKIETGSGMLLDYLPIADEQYIDIFDVLPSFYQMTGNELIQWLEKQGCSFKKASANITMEVISNK